MSVHQFGFSLRDDKDVSVIDQGYQIETKSVVFVAGPARKLTPLVCCNVVFIVAWLVHCHGLEATKDVDCAFRASLLGPRNENHLVSAHGRWDFRQLCQSVCRCVKFGDQGRS